MKYKVISLILIIPIVLMFCVFSAANIASLSISIPVSSVTVFHQMQEKINLAETDEFQINAQVLPRNATNKGLVYSYEAVNGYPLPNLSIDENGLVKASGYGVAKITVTTKDGAYKKSFLVEVTSTLASDIILSLSKTDDIMIGDEFVVDCLITPQETLDRNVVFSSSNQSIVKIDSLSGECKAISSGKVTLKATLENGLNGKIEKTMDIVVLPNASSSPITFDGSIGLTEKIYSNDFSAVMEINFSSLYALGITLEKNDIILDYQTSKVESVELIEISNNNGIYKFNVVIKGLNDDSFNLKASLNFENYVGYISEINLEKVVDLNDIEINLSNFKNYIRKNSTNSFKINILPKDFEGYTLEVFFEKENISLSKTGEIYYIRSSKVTSDKLIVNVLVEGEILKSFSENVDVLDPPTSINFSHNTENHGIEDLLTIANEKIVLNEQTEKLEYKPNNHIFDFTTEINTDYVEFSSSDESVAKFENGALVILKEGKITITATELQSKLLGSLVSASLNLRCVNGVEVSTYEQLVKATKENKQVVLVNDIMLGQELVRFNEDGTTTILENRSESDCLKILSSELNEIETTGEWNYYKNNDEYQSGVAKDQKTPPKINYIIKFTNNIFGNGYVLNANNITNLVDSTNSLYSFAKFRGPLDLVAIPNASVKGQDNICFIASDNVTINNVELVGANLRGLDTTDLNQLNYTGTVLEVMGDNVKIVNSRIRNGRNCVRVFGKENNQNEKINVLIESCIISNAREFLIKMGTNAKLYGEFKQRDSINLANGIADEKIWEECSPKIEGFEHFNKQSLNENEYNALVDSYIQNEDFMSLVKTNLTIKNCVLYTSGLFSIGLESSFAGPALDGGRWNSWDFNSYGWRNIAGTSYPTMLNLEGSVRIYDWKDLSNIDSSTLIEGGLFDFNLSKMIEDLYSDGKFTDIITEIGDNKYCHGGIVMYGGGKNYALINSNTQNEKLNNYVLSLDSLNTSLTTMLKYASGKEPFRLFIYGKNSQFNYYKQVADLQNGEAFNEIGKFVF